MSSFDNPANGKDAKRHTEKTHRGFWKLIERRIEELSPTAKDRQRFKALLGMAPMEGPLRLSDLVAHYRFSRDVIREVRHLAQVSQDLDFYHLTLLADEGNMRDRKPSFALSLLKRKADKAMRKTGLEGIYVIEVQPLINWPQKGKGRTLLGHVHILGWKRCDAPENSVPDIRRLLGYDKRRRNLAWSSLFGADPIHVRSISPARGCPSFWAAYLLKLPHEAKSLVPRRGEDGASLQETRYKLRSTSRGYRPDLAMRVLELFAQLPLFAMIGGVGAGHTILGRCRNRLKLWDEQRLARWRNDGIEWVQAFNERKFWQRTHKNRRATYHPFFIDGPTIAQRATKRRL